MLFVTLSLSELKPAPWAYETVWTILAIFTQPPYSFVAYLMNSKLCLYPRGSPQSVTKHDQIHISTATEFDPSSIRTQSYPAPPSW